MKNRTKNNIAKLNRVADAWEKLAPDAIFAGMTLAQFKAKTKPTLDKQAAILAMEADLTGNRRELMDISRDSYNWTGKVINAIRGDVNYGDDCPLYAAIGYIRRSERKSGRTWKAQAAAAAKKPAA